MPTLVCSCCGEEAEGKNFTEADTKIDHAKGQSRGRPCGGDPRNLTWDGKVVGELKTRIEPEPRKQAESIDVKPEKRIPEGETAKEPEKEAPEESQNKETKKPKGSAKKGK